MDIPVARTVSSTADRGFYIDIGFCLHLRIIGLLIGLVTQTTQLFCCRTVAICEEVSMAHATDTFNP